ncbi:MAG: hypothetical protein JSS99_17595 [Actinobacteria bacterium]|nr:hypothetical protein [Actinomycetota bacterium]
MPATTPLVRAVDTPAPARQLDAAWVAVLAALRGRELRRLPLLVGGRSSGARVACRTAAEVRAVGVLCLAFPQGERDRFGIPPAAPGRELVVVRGDHSLRSDAAGVGDAVQRWLERVLAP